MDVNSPALVLTLKKKKIQKKSNKLNSLSGPKMLTAMLPYKLWSAYTD